MKKHTRTIAAMAVIAGVLSGFIGATPLRAQEQPVHSLQELQSKLDTDDELKVTDQNKKTSTGRLISISGSSLTLLVKGKPQEFSEATLREIKQRRPHKVKSVLLGAVIVARRQECLLQQVIPARSAPIRPPRQRESRLEPESARAVWL